MLSAFLLSLLLGFVSTGVIFAGLLYTGGRRLTPDGAMYLSAGRGERVPMPYSMRWLLPSIFSSNRVSWSLMSIGSGTLMISSLIFSGTLLTGIGLSESLVILMLMVGLPVFKLNLKYEAMVDLLAMALAVYAASALYLGLPYLAILLSLLSGATKETGPILSVFVGLTLQPSALPFLLAIGCIAPMLRYLQVRRWEVPIPKAYEWLNNPFRSARLSRASGGGLVHRLVLPWGGLLVLLPFTSTPVVTVLAMLTFYGQLLMANDEARLYQWSAPVVLLGTVTAISSLSVPVMYFVCLIHLLNPYSEVPV